MEGRSKTKYQHLPHPPVRVLKTFADLSDRQTPLPVRFMSLSGTFRRAVFTGYLIPISSRVIGFPACLTDFSNAQISNFFFRFLSYFFLFGHKLFFKDVLSMISKILYSFLARRDNIFSPSCDTKLLYV